MSIIVTVYNENGFAMATDSRTTYENDNSFVDNNDKLFFLNNLNVGISHCGNACFNGMYVTSFLEALTNKLTENDNVLDVARKLKKLVQESGSTGAIFHVAGYADKRPYVLKVNDIDIVKLNTEKIYNIKDKEFNYKDSLERRCGCCADGVTEYLERYFTNIGSFEDSGIYYNSSLEDILCIARKLVLYTIEQERKSPNKKYCGESIKAIYFNKFTNSYVDAKSNKISKFQYTDLH